MQSFDGECWEADAGQGGPETDIVSAAQVDKARAQYAKDTKRLQEVQARITAITERRAALLGQLKTDELLMRIRQLGDDIVTRTGMLIIAVVAISGLVVVLCHLIALSFSFLLFCFVIAWTTIGFFGIKLFKPDDAILESKIDSAKRELSSLQEKEKLTQQQLVKSRKYYHYSRSLYETILSRFKSRINRLRTTNWELLQGVPFEQFLEDVFVEWGYSVSTTKASGDQGVDLIISKRGVSTAVQAKGYISSTVGNSAVQEAYAGMAHYRCQKCAVITNSTFTSSARELAGSVGCALIDHDMIVALIEGNIEI